MSDEYASEVDLTRIDPIIDDAINKICDEYGYSKEMHWNAGFTALMNRINELHKMSIKGN